MRIGVVGLWHLGEDVSSCLAELGHTVTAYDPDPAVIEKFRRGEPVLAEPDIWELMAKNKKAGLIIIRFSRLVTYKRAGLARSLQLAQHRRF